MKLYQVQLLLKTFLDLLVPTAEQEPKKHFRDLIGEMYQTGKGCKIISKALPILWNTVNTVINKGRKYNWMSLQNSWKDWSGAAGIPGVDWSCTTCNNNVCSLRVTRKDKEKEMHSKPLEKQTSSLKKACGQIFVMRSVLNFLSIIPKDMLYI